MKAALSSTLALILLYSSAFATDENTQTHFGGEFTLNNPVSVDQAIEHYGKSPGKEVLISGKTTKLCRTKGCWMVLKGTSNVVRVTFKDYKFFVPPSLLGKEVLVQGELLEKTMGISEARHFAKDAGKSALEINAIDQPIKEYRFIASAVKLKQ